jgi:hypothetical protein
VHTCAPQLSPLGYLLTSASVLTSVALTFVWTPVGGGLYLIRRVFVARRSASEQLLLCPWISVGDRRGIIGPIRRTPAHILFFSPVKLAAYIVLGGTALVLIPVLYPILLLGAGVFICLGSPPSSRLIMELATSAPAFPAIWVSCLITGEKD